MRILFVFNHPAPYKVAFLNLLAQHVDLTVIFERKKNRDRPKDFYSEGRHAFHLLPIRGIPLGNENLLSNGVVRHLRHHCYDLVIMNGYAQIPEILAVRWLKKHHVPYCLAVNGGIIDRKESRFKCRLKRSLIAGASFYLSPDEKTNEYLVYYGAPLEKIRNYAYATIHAFEISQNKLTEEEKKKRKRALGITHEHVFVSAGQLIKRKNYPALIHAWETMPKDTLLIIAGEGKDHRQLERLIAHLPSKNVQLRGFLARHDLFELYKIADAFVFASREDIYGHVINEALSQGLPIISTKNVNAARKLIKDGVNGYLVDDIEGEAFKDAIRKVLEKDMQEACLKTAGENTYERMVEDHLNVLADWERKQ